MSTTSHPARGPDGEVPQPEPGDLLSGLPDGVVVVGPDLRIRYANPAAAALTGAAGLSPGRHLADVLPGPADDLDAACTRVRESGRPEVLHQHDDATGRWLRLRLLPGNGTTTLLLRDATPEVRASLERNRRLDVLEELVRHTDAVMTVKDLQGRYVFANAAAAATSGLTSPEEMLGRTAEDLFGPALGSTSRERELAVQIAGRPIHLQETYDGGDQEPSTYLSVRFPVFDEGGVMSGTGAVLTDISGWRLTRRDLALSEQRLRDVFARTTLGFLVVDREADVTLEANEAAAAMLGWSVDELVGQPSRAKVVDVAAWTARHQQARARGARGYEIEAEVYRRDGSTLPVLATVSSLDDQGRLVSLILRDLSPLHELQQRLVDAERLEAVGSVAGGIAHDVANVLAAVGGYAELLEAAVAGSPEAERHVAGIQRSVARAGDFVDRLLAFARRQRLEPVDVDLAGTAVELADMCRRLLPDDVGLVLEAPGPVPVRADASQVQQVLLNLVLNARDAVVAGPGSGTVRVVVDRTRTEGGSWARARVVDDGAGMAPEVARRCFEPFFTTRTGRGGHGLGLATALGIARQSGGDLTVTSTPGTGTTFTLLLPLGPGSEDAPEHAPDSPAPEVPAPEAGPSVARPVDDRVDPVVRPAQGVVLVVDDDPDVLEVMASVLRAARHEVETADGGHEAADRARRLGDRLRLLVTDVEMPDGDGVSLARTLRAHAPGLPVLFVSGTAQAPDVPGTTFLAKPVRGRELRAVVASLLGGRTA